MKHGDKAKAKSAKAASKTSSGKNSKAVAAKTKSKTGKIAESKKPDRNKAPAAKISSSKPAGGNGKPQGRGPAEALGFTNPLVASAFKRAIKKFPTAFRRLTD